MKYINKHTSNGSKFNKAANNLPAVERICWLEFDINLKVGVSNKTTYGKNNFRLLDNNEFVPSSLLIVILIVNSFGSFDSKSNVDCSCTKFIKHLHIDNNEDDFEFGSASGSSRITGGTLWRI